MDNNRELWAETQTLRNMAKDLRRAIAEMAAQIEAMNNKIDDQDRQIKDLQWTAAEAQRDAA